MDLSFYQSLYDTGLSLDALCRQYPEAKQKRFFLQKNLRLRTRSQAAVLAQTGKPLSESHRKSISKSMTLFFAEHPDEIPYRKYHHSKGRSYPEQVLAAELSRQSVTGWEQEYRASIYTYDFAFVSAKLDVEVDGSTHQRENVKLIDAKRDEWTKSQGWRVLRFPAKQVISDAATCVQMIRALLDQKHARANFDGEASPVI